MKMLLLRVIVTLVACWIVKCDLLDLYVQHMDETMRTTLYRNKRHPMDPVSRRIKRSLEEDEPLFRFNYFKKQRLNVDENWVKQWKAKNKIVPYKNDILDFPNKLEGNVNSDQHEIFPTLNIKYSERTSTVLEDAAENSQLNISQVPITEEREETSEVGLIIEENQSNEELTVKALEFEEFPEEMESEDNSQFEIISENEQIDPNPFRPSFKRRPWDSRMPKKYFPEKPVKEAQKAKNYVKDEAAVRFRRNANDLSNEGRWNFTRYEKMDENGTVILEWDPSNEEKIIFRVTGETRGYIGIGFNEKTSMEGADILLIWIDDATNLTYVLDLHGVERNAAPVIDISQDVEVISGTQNGNRTVVTFARKWKTCDHQDHELTGDSIKVLWALHKEDPILNTAVWHGQTRGGKTLRLKTAAAHSPPQESSDIRHWDVKLTRFEVTNTTNTIYWCKIFKPSVNKKHHMIGYTPLIEKGNQDLIHHIILYECTSPMLGKYTRMAGNHCYISAVPKEWNSCLQPILAWARGSKGEWMPEHVGIPIAEQSENSYYMLEVHYNNQMLKNVNDSSGVRLHLTEKLRPKEAGILVTGVAVSPLHLIPPQRKEYATVGYCTSECTHTMFPKEGINIISVVLHSHLAGRRLGLKHIRKGKELPRIVQDNHYDFDYQQSYTLEKEVKVLPGDELAAECIYGTLDREKPTFGGYAVTQEMCLAFAVYYPKTPLAACYSMTPVKHLFKILAVTNFRGMTMDYLETLFLTNESELISPSTKQLPSHSKSTDEIDETIIKEAKSALIAMKDHIEESEDDNIFTRLIIEDPIEFRGRTFAEHMMLMQWKDDLLAKPVEYNLYHGEHMTFCRKRDDQLVLRPNILNFPNYTALQEINTCELKSDSSKVFYIHWINLIITVITLIAIL
ncbi:PREDICTED: MOXD1 homolog 1 [Trachymyrmex cornetzi]|uniref:MOXD1 homolog 1 n=1 Tax=Trachymyrmex cornetzi TaxID=471704 RepID=UPI00084EF2C4|nr:PREDICTED: MOXD1 homolog 1 [Trachymyrmex cornetzi]